MLDTSSLILTLSLHGPSLLRPFTQIELSPSFFFFFSLIFPTFSPQNQRFPQLRFFAVKTSCDTVVTPRGVTRLERNLKVEILLQAFPASLSSPWTVACFRIAGPGSFSIVLAGAAPRLTESLEQATGMEVKGFLLRSLLENHNFDVDMSIKDRTLNLSESRSDVFSEHIQLV